MVPWLPCLICLSAPPAEARRVLGETTACWTETPPCPSSEWDLQKQEGVGRCDSP